MQSWCDQQDSYFVIFMKNYKQAYQQSLHHKAFFPTHVLTRLAEEAFPPKAMLSKHKCSSPFINNYAFAFPLVSSASFSFACFLFESLNLLTYGNSKSMYILFRGILLCEENNVTSVTRVSQTGRNILSSYECFRTLGKCCGISNGGYRYERGKNSKQNAMKLLPLSMHTLLSWQIDKHSLFLPTRDGPCARADSILIFVYTRRTESSFFIQVTNTGETVGLANDTTPRLR